jgi:hypothetical protein
VFDPVLYRVPEEFATATQRKGKIMPQSGEKQMRLEYLVRDSLTEARLRQNIADAWSQVAHFEPSLREHLERDGYVTPEVPFEIEIDQGVEPFTAELIESVASRQVG